MVVGQQTCTSVQGYYTIQRSTRDLERKVSVSFRAPACGTVSPSSKRAEFAVHKSKIAQRIGNIRVYFAINPFSHCKGSLKKVFCSFHVIQNTVDRPKVAK
ncbi:hypothetical protein OS493_034688 [Desmophyllum pertusum]|uniref:Uncharacterized protein n=1 Tax=Desmophyllum pertusum TaxID=174260 RepID=A0A9W9Z724_9CNID|nr:hypothetical protein OS493_034688 [Desmophyllum pertusum]